MLIELIPLFTVFAILTGALILFISNKLPIDLTAMLVLVAVMLTGLVPEADIMSGLSNPATVTIAAMFMLSGGLEKTGVVAALVQKLRPLAKGGRASLTFVLSITSGFMSAFVNNTAVVAMLLPVAIGLSKERKISPSQILMPLSFAAQMGGVCTLIGTSTNLLVNAIAREEGYTGLGLFDFSLMGMIIFAVGLAYMMIVAPFLLPKAEPNEDFSSDYNLDGYLSEMTVKEGSKLIGQKVFENDITELGNLTFLEIIRGEEVIWAASNPTIQEGDILLLKGQIDKLIKVAPSLKLEYGIKDKIYGDNAPVEEMKLMEVILTRSSGIVGKSLAQNDFFRRYKSFVLGIRRQGTFLRRRIAKVELQDGDTLLLQGTEENLDRLQEDNDMLMIRDLDALQLRHKYARRALVIMILVVVLAAFDVLSIMVASITGVMAMILTRCLTIQGAYRSVDMTVIILLVGLIPLGQAMRNSGMTDLLVNNMFDLIGGYGPLFILAMFYLITALLTEIMSNTATAILMTSPAIAMAETLGLRVEPFLIAIMFAASTSFATPVGYQTNTMILGPGKYKYSDFIRVGLPLNTIFFAVSMYLIPQFWPF